MAAGNEVSTKFSKSSHSTSTTGTTFFLTAEQKDNFAYQRRYSTEYSRSFRIRPQIFSHDCLLALTTAWPEYRRAQTRAEGKGMILRGL